MPFIPAGLAAYHQFVLWIAVPSKTRPGKTDKFPINSQGQVVDAHDPTNWLTEPTAQALLASGIGHGIGFVFTEADPFFFLDIDGAAVGGEWSPIAVQLCHQFAGCFVEVSHSGTGLHIIGSAPPIEHGTRNQSHGLELYTKLRYVALTGNHASGDPCYKTDLTSLVADYFPATGLSGPVDNWTTAPHPDWSGPEDDSDLLYRMLTSRASAASIFGGKATVGELWEGKTECYGDDHSAADAALLAHLAFWTGRDCERMDRLFRMSGLMRDKWDRSAGQGRTYGQLSTLKAAANCSNVLSLKKKETPDDAVPADPVTGLRDGSQYLSIIAQIEHFTGCVYIRNLHRIFTPDGSLLKSEQFRATYGGYLFAMDLNNEKTTRSAWEAFTESNGFCFPHAHDPCFRPEIPSGAIVREEDRVLVNTYVPITTAARQGDVSPFLNHVAKLIPDTRDQLILLSYMAAVVQYPGVKFQWAPLVQGLEGNGKTLLVTALQHCVGSRYSHLPNANDISNKFNSWLLGKLFIGIEEIYTVDRKEAIETLKPLITNSRVEIQAKGSDQITGDNRANFMLTSNHQDAIRKTELDRRYCIFFTAQQQPGDLERDGMTGNYFPMLYDWLRTDGYQIINWWLRQYPIPDEFNPATNCHRAPETSSNKAAIKASLGSVEQEVLEAIEEELPGFAGGWVSSLAFDRLLELRRASRQIPVNKRKGLLESLGYYWHPHLINGRVNNSMIDVGGIAGKPKLYIRRGNPAVNLTNCADIVKSYLDAQAGGTVAGQAFGQGVTA